MRLAGRPLYDEMSTCVSEQYENGLPPAWRMGWWPMTPGPATVVVGAGVRGREGALVIGWWTQTSSSLRMRRLLDSCHHDSSAIINLQRFVLIISLRHRNQQHREQRRTFDLFRELIGRRNPPVATRELNLAEGSPPLGELPLASQMRCLLFDAEQPHGTLVSPNEDPGAW